MKKSFILVFAIIAMAFTTVDAQTTTEVSEDGKVSTTTTTVGNMRTITRITNVNGNQLIATEHYKVTSVWGTHLKDWEVLVVNDSGTIVHQDNSEKSNRYRGYDYYRSSNDWYGNGYETIVPYYYVSPNYRVYGGYYQRYDMSLGFWINIGFCNNQYYNRGYYWNQGRFYNRGGYTYYNNNRAPYLGSRYQYNNYTRIVSVANTNRNVVSNGNRTVNNPTNRPVAPYLQRNNTINANANRTISNNPTVNRAPYLNRQTVPSNRALNNPNANINRQNVQHNNVIVPRYMVRNRPVTRDSNATRRMNAIRNNRH